MLFPECLSKAPKYSSVYAGEMKPVSLFGELLLSQNHSIFLLFFLSRCTSRRLHTYPCEQPALRRLLNHKGPQLLHIRVLVSAFLNRRKDDLRGDEAVFFHGKGNCLFEKICRMSGHCRIGSVRHSVYYRAMSLEDAWLYSGLRFSLRAAIYSSIRYIHSFWTKNFSFIVCSIFCMYLPHVSAHLIIDSV